MSPVTPATFAEPEKLMQVTMSPNGPTYAECQPAPVAGLKVGYIAQWMKQPCD